MALSTAVIVANIYYCQPLIILIAREFGRAESDAGRITYLTQAGYATGLLFLVPLGDRVERKRQILFTAAMAVVALLAAAVAPSFMMLCIASVVIGFSSVVPQLILPLSAHLAEPGTSGRVIGTVMSGLLVGILLSRTLSGAVGAALGWRAMYFIAAGFCLVILMVIAKTFPVSKPSFKGSYGQLMQSLWNLVNTQPVLREAAMINALAFAVFGCFWTTMVLLLAGNPYHFTSAAIGLFGVAGAIGALAAPVIGRISDKKNPRTAIGYGLAMMATAVVLLYSGELHLAMVIVAVLILDLGQQGIHVSNQARIYALIPEARNRLNTVFMTCSFIGTACGSAAGLKLWEWKGWTGVCIGMSGLVTTAFAVYGITYRKTRVVLRSGEQ
ncbi:MFS transporter [Pedobacter sp. HMF7056]|uniref:MFS transporter n=2 Tax=Hufsiella ginkgonis TaxID=2695274 RepID=A0A7K1XZ23_9SPHI|nr:MFS transporter [Hufsiella ginkgonis]